MEHTLSKRGAGTNLMAATLILAFIAVAVVIFSPTIAEFLNHNPYLNGLIILVFIIGLSYAMFWLVRIQHEFNMLEDVRIRWNVDGDRKRLNSEVLENLPRSEVRERLMFYAAQVSRGTPPNSEKHSEKVYMIMGLHTQIVRYVAGLLVFIGLLGTFIGLLATIGGVEKVINTLPNSSENIQDSLEGLRTSLGGPLKGMATAFSTSIFGLFTSLIIGFLHLQVASSQTRFISRLEALDASLFLPVFLAMARQDNVPLPDMVASVTVPTPAAPPEIAQGGLSDGLARYMEATQRQLKENLDRLMAIVERTEGLQANYREVLLTLSQEIQTTNVTISRLSTNQDLIREAMSNMVDITRSENEGQKLMLSEMKTTNETLARSITAQQATHAAILDHQETLTQILRREMGTLDKMSGREMYE